MIHWGEWRCGGSAVYGCIPGWVLAVDGEGVRAPVIQARALCTGTAGAAFPDGVAAVDQQSVQDVSDRSTLTAYVDQGHIGRHGQHVADLVLVAEGSQVGSRP